MCGCEEKPLDHVCGEEGQLLLDVDGLGEGKCELEKRLEMSWCRYEHGCTESGSGCTVMLLRSNYHAWTFVCRGIFFSNL